MKRLNIVVCQLIVVEKPASLLSLAKSKVESDKSKDFPAGDDNWRCRTGNSRIPIKCKLMTAHILVL